jgi:hypothetical protein
MSKSEVRFGDGGAYWRRGARISVGFRSGRDEGVKSGESARVRVDGKGGVERARDGKELEEGS